MVRLARWIFLKTFAFIAHLCAVTLPTPPAPMMSTVPSFIRFYPSAYRFDEQEQFGNLITKNAASVTSIGVERLAKLMANK